MSSIPVFPDMHLLTLMFDRLLYDNDKAQVEKRAHGFWLEILPVGSNNDVEVSFGTCHSHDG
jgi:hypothetical protein